MNLKKKIAFFVVSILFFSLSLPALANEKVNVYLFWGEGCPHCAKEKIYLQELADNEPRINLITFEIYKNKNNATLLQTAAEKINVPIDGVPFLIIGDQHYVGYSAKLSPDIINNRVNECLNSHCPDNLASLLGGIEQSTTENSTDSVHMNGETESELHIPIIGTLNLKNLSLPVISIVLGVIDGFNPCAMWTLLFLISLLLGMENKKRMWILGSLFIVVSAFVYFLFMAAWLKLLMFIGFIIWVRLLIGGVALLGGGYNLKEFFTSKKDSGCKVTKGDKKQKVFEKLKKITQEHSLWLAALGIILLAFAVNLVELICSAGLPAIFIQILALNDLSSFQYYLYILLYILFFMIDDLFIFFAAMITLHLTGITTKYTRITKLIGGILMILIGVILLLKPEWLMFG